MKSTLVMLLIVSGLCFGVWPLVVRRSDQAPLVQGLTLATLTACVLSFAYVKYGNAGWTSFFVAGAVFAVVAGILNGLGTVLYLKGINSVPRVDLTRAVLVVVITQIVTNELGGIFFYGTPVTIRKLLGFGTAAASVFLLVR